MRLECWPTACGGGEETTNGKWLKRAIFGLDLGKSGVENSLVIESDGVAEGFNRGHCAVD